LRTHPRQTTYLKRGRRTMSTRHWDRKDVGELPLESRGRNRGGKGEKGVSLRRGFDGKCLAEKIRTALASGEKGGGGHATGRCAGRLGRIAGVAGKAKNVLRWEQQKRVAPLRPNT